MSSEAAIIRITAKRDVNSGIGAVCTPVAVQCEMPVPYAFYAMKELGFTHLPLIDGGHQALGAFAATDAFGDELADCDDLAHGRKAFAKACA